MKLKLSIKEYDKVVIATIAKSYFIGRIVSFHYAASKSDRKHSTVIIS